MNAARTTPVNTEVSGREIHAEHATEPSGDNPNTTMVLEEDTRSSFTTLQILLRHGSACCEATPKTSPLRSLSTGQSMLTHDNKRILPYLGACLSTSSKAFAIN